MMQAFWDVPAGGTWWNINTKNHCLVKCWIGSISGFKSSKRSILRVMILQTISILEITIKMAMKPDLVPTELESLISKVHTENMQVY
jgi:hypothetical protein